MKNFLAFGVFLICSGGGIYLSVVLKKRSQMLAMLAELMNAFQRVMEKKKCSVREAAEQVQKSFDDPNGQILLNGLIKAWETPGNIEHAWNCTLEEICQNVPDFIMLQADEKARLARFVRDQAISEFQSECSNIGATVWEDRAKIAKEVYMTKGKLYGKLGLLLGLTLVILMM